MEAFLGRCGRHPSPDLGSDSAQGAAARLGCLGEETQEELEVGQQRGMPAFQRVRPPPGSQRGLWVKIPMLEPRRQDRIGAKVLLHPQTGHRAVTVAPEMGTETSP